MSRSEELIQELESADFVVIATPMHNFTVPAALKAWIDHVVRVRRTFDVTAQGKLGALRDRPVFVAVSSGGRFSGDRAHQPDFLTPYLKAILGTIGLHDLTFFSVEGSALGPDALVAARTKADQAMQRFFLRFARQFNGGVSASCMNGQRPSRAQFGHRSRRGARAGKLGDAAPRGIPLPARPIQRPGS